LAGIQAQNATARSTTGIVKLGLWVDRCSVSYLWSRPCVCRSSCTQILTRVNVVQDKLRALLVSVRSLGLEAFVEVVNRLQALLNDVFEPSAFLVTFLKNVAATAQNAAGCAQSLEVVFNMTALVDRLMSPDLLQLVTDALSSLSSTVTDISTVVGALDTSGVELLYQYVT
jgi:hypothetical protein